MPSRTIRTWPTSPRTRGGRAWSPASCTRFRRLARRSGRRSRTARTCSIRPAFRWTTLRRTPTTSSASSSSSRDPIRTSGASPRGGTSTFGLNSGSAFLAVFRTPNNWKLDSSGKLVKDYETDEFKAAVGFARDLWSAGLYHPNTPTYGGTGNPDYAAGRFAVQVSVWGQYIQNWDLLASVNPNGKTYPMHPFAADGGTPVYLAGNGNFGMTFIKQQPSADRVKMLLRVANFFAAPFGSQEWLLNYYGVKDVDYKFDDDRPANSDRSGPRRADGDLAIHHLAAVRAVRHGPIAGVRHCHTCRRGGDAGGGAVRSDARPPIRRRRFSWAFRRKRRSMPACRTSCSGAGHFPTWTDWSPTGAPPPATRCAREYMDALGPPVRAREPRLEVRPTSQFSAQIAVGRTSVDRLGLGYRGPGAHL